MGQLLAVSGCGEAELGNFRYRAGERVLLSLGYTVEGLPVGLLL